MSGGANKRPSIGSLGIRFRDWKDHTIRRAPHMSGGANKRPSIGSLGIRFRDWTLRASGG
eukprot:COSAG02_NODE_750_length_17669_cov_242.395595_5_plen_60_part_00